MGADAIKKLPSRSQQALQAQMERYKSELQHPPPGSVMIGWGCATAVLAASGLGSIVAEAIIVPGFLGLLGFGESGITAESAAARWQSKIGDVEEGSLFAVLQSIAMAGLSRSRVV